MSKKSRDGSRTRVMNNARRRLQIGFEVKNSVLFAAAATACGIAWDGTKNGGYAVVNRYMAEKARTPIPVTTRSQRLVSPEAGSAFLETYAWRSLRMRVLTARGARCECCGAAPKDGVRINVDHIKPRKRFPELALEESNLQVLCEPCNHGKGNWDETDWRPKLVKRA